MRPTQDMYSNLELSDQVSSLEEREASNVVDYACNGGVGGRRC